MKRIHFAIAVAASLLSCSRPEVMECDICVYGGTSAGVIAAYSAVQEGKSVLIVEPGYRLGGLSSGGLGQTDIGNKQVIAGVAKQFYRKVGEHYGRLEQWIFEPSVADSIMRAYIDHKNIVLMDNYRIRESHLDGTRICEIVLENSNDPSRTKTIKADYFIDCYEVVRELVEDGIVSAGISIGNGGLATAAVRFCEGMGARLDISGVMSSYGEDDSTRILFGEIPGVLVQIRDNDYDYFDSQMILQDIAYYPLGHPSSALDGVRFGEKGRSSVAGILASLLTQASEGED